MSDILEDLRRADARGVAPPQNWTTRAADEIARLRKLGLDDLRPPGNAGETDEQGNPMPHPILQSGPVEHLWVYDPPGANVHAWTHPKATNYPPHWLRCDFMRDGERCVKGSGHEHSAGKQAEHEAPKHVV